MPVSFIVSMSDDMKRILLVEDEESIAHLATVVLQKCDYAVSHARSGDEALEIIEGLAPDLLLTDNMMPGMDGVDLCRRVRRLPDIGSIPIVMLSAAREPEEVSGVVDAYIRKPFTPARLVAVVRQSMDGHGPESSSGFLDV